MEEVTYNVTIAVIMVCSACHKVQTFVEQDQGAPAKLRRGDAPNYAVFISNLIFFLTFHFHCKPIVELPILSTGG